VESELGRGTCFTLSLPLLQNTSQPSQPVLRAYEIQRGTPT
jgi:hypothetical protein